MKLIGNSLNDVVVLAIPDPFEKINVTSGGLYTQSFEVNLVDVSGHGLRLMHQWFNATTPYIIPFRSDYGNWETGTSNWHVISLTKTAPEGSVKGDIAIELWGKGSVYVRNPRFYISIEEKN